MSESDSLKKYQVIVQGLKPNRLVKAVLIVNTPKGLLGRIEKKIEEEGEIC